MSTQSLQRTKTLVFKTWELFRSWYSIMKKRFSMLTLRYMKFSPGHPTVRVIISY